MQIHIRQIYQKTERLDYQASQDIAFYYVKLLMIYKLLLLDCEPNNVTEV